MPSFPTLHELNNLGDLLKYEADQRFSRERVTLASGQNLALGTVIAIDDATDQITQLDQDAITSVNKAAGVLLDACDATSAANPDALIVARQAIVARNAVVWPAGITAPQQALAEAQLKALGILVRQAA